MFSSIISLSSTPLLLKLFALTSILEAFRNAEELLHCFLKYLIQSDSEAFTATTIQVRNYIDWGINEGKYKDFAYTDLRVLAMSASSLCLTAQDLQAVVLSTSGLCFTL